MKLIRQQLGLMKNVSHQPYLMETIVIQAKSTEPKKMSIIGSINTIVFTLKKKIKKKGNTQNKFNQMLLTVYTQCTKKITTVVL